MNKELLKKTSYITYMISEYGIEDKIIIGAMIAHMDEHDILDEFIQRLPIFVANIKKEQN